MLANLSAAGPAWTAGYAVGSVVVDADHLQLVPRRHRIGKETPRPPAHTLLVPAGLAAAACVTRARAREILLGVAVGTCVHFVRDVATGSGLAPLQPLARRRVKCPGTHTRRRWPCSQLERCSDGTPPGAGSNSLRTPEKALRFAAAYSRSRPSVAPRHISGASGRGP